MMKIKSRITIFILLANCTVNAQRVSSLNDILQIIDSANPTAKMYAAQIRSLDEAAKGTKNWMPTEFGTGFWMTPYNPKLFRKGDNGATGMGQYMLSAQQMFPNKKKQNAEAAYMEGMSASEKERQKFQANQLYAEAKKNYYQLIIQKKKMNVLTENEKLLNFIIKDAEIRYKNGLDKLSIYYKAKAEVGRILNMKVELENEYNQNRIRLNTLMNRNKFEPFDIDTTYTVKDLSLTIFDTATINNRSDIKEIEKDIKLAHLQQNMERTKVKPEFGIRYDHMFGFGGFPMQYTLMGMAKIPLGKANLASKANVESLKWKSEALFQQKQILLNEAIGMATGIRVDIDAKKRQVKLFEENIIPALRKNYQVMQLGYQQNTEQLFTLFDAWDVLNKTQIEYLNQLQQLVTMQVELERVLEVK